jgi:hypothetical protein
MGRNVSKKRTLALASILSLVALAGLGQTSTSAPADPYEMVMQSLVKAYNAEDYDGTYRDFDKEMLDAVPPQTAKELFQGLMKEHGPITKLGAKTSQPPFTVFPATFRSGVTLDFKLVLDSQGKIAGLQINPHRSATSAPEKHQAKLRLPFNGEWTVFWGGDTEKENQHHKVENQKFAFDFIVVDQSGRSCKSEGKTNEDYYAFGQPILAPGDGVVTEAIDGVRDNVPGAMNPYSAIGNAVVIQHRQDEVSFLAHLKQGSVKVKAGDKVKAGQVIGLCGNSGHSSEPHLHYHLQNTPIIQDGIGIKCVFENVTVKGKTSVQGPYSPVKGEVVSPSADKP